MKFSIETEIEIKITCEGKEVPYTPARPYGDPPQPEEGGYFEDIVIKIGDIDITEHIPQDVIDDLQEQLAEEASEYGDYVASMEAYDRMDEI